MSVLLTHAYFLADDPKEQQIMKPYPPLGLLYLSAYLDRHLVDNTVFDTTFSSLAELQNQILSTRPSVAAIYVNLMTKLNVLKIVSFIKQQVPETKIVLGGPEVRHSAENFLRQGADVIVIGEGEETMYEVATCFLNGNELHADLKGIAFLDNEKFIQTAEREKLRDLDELPEPARHKIDLTLYLDRWKKHHGKSTISVSTMRGCPYTCKWCSRAVYGLSYRRRSPEKVVSELKNIIINYHPDSFWFVDDVFTISHKWLNGFKEELAKKNINIRYECITRADRMNEEVVKVLKETGCFRVWIGAESGSQKVIDLMDRRVDVNQVREMIRLSRRHGIEAGTFIMLGYPGETEDDIEETIRHLKQSNPDHFTVTVAYPIRGTELFQEVETTNGDLSWASSTDREIDFKRSYSRPYYDMAVRRLINEVNYHRVSNPLSFRSARFKIKSIMAKIGMLYYKLR
jgi:anaerobic magnesium-protoporphyrin IX monomethyl ester cyclase